MRIAAENTSGQGSLAVIPEEIKGWNWGAFFFGGLWGICNKVWISLLAAIPYVGVIMCIVLGVKGNEWAWRHKKWDSIEHFKSTQRKWGIAGVVVHVVGVIILIIALVAGSVSPSPEPPIPAHFTTYTDEAGLFNISYPPDWEPAPLLKKLFEQAIEQPVNYVFVAWKPVASYKGFDATVTISVIEEAGLDEESLFGNTLPEYYEFSRTKTTIGKKKAVIIDYEANFSGVKNRRLTMLVAVDNNLWKVSCRATPGKFSNFEDDFNAIVRSLRILK